MTDDVNPWEKVHAIRQWGKYPNEHVIRFALGHYGKLPRSKVRFLDIGCGFGAQTCFLAHEGFKVRAVDISASAINRLRARLRAERIGPMVAPQIMDICNLHEVQQFDAIVDCCSLQQLSPDNARRAIERCQASMRNGGRMLSIMAAVRTGEAVTGPEFGGVEPVRRDIGDIGNLFLGFSVLKIGRESVDRPDGTKVDHWLVEATR